MKRPQHRNETRARSTARSALAIAALAVLPVACGGSGIEGRYAGVGDDSLLESVTLGSDGVAGIVYPFGLGNSGQGSYVVDGDSVTLTSPSGDRARFQIDDNGCLTNLVVGTLCKGGPAGAAGGGAAAATGGGGGAEVYEATTAEGRITLELNAGGAARMTMVPFGGGGNGVPQRMSFDLQYEVNNGNVVVELPGEGPTQLVRTGRDLLMTSNGETARFIRQ